MPVPPLPGTCRTRGTMRFLPSALDPGFGRQDMDPVAQCGVLRNRRASASQPPPSPRRTAGCPDTSSSDRSSSYDRDRLLPTRHRSGHVPERLSRSMPVYAGAGVDFLIVFVPGMVLSHIA